MTMAGLRPWGWCGLASLNRQAWIGLSVGFFHKWGQSCELRGRTRYLGPTAASGPAVETRDFLLLGDLGGQNQL